MKSRAQAVQDSMSFQVRELLNAGSGITDTYWADPKGRKCRFCGSVLYRFRFQDRQAYKCRKLGCFLENQLQGYAR